MELRVRDRAAFAATGGRPFDPALPTVVFVHGAGMDHSIWVLPGRWFARHGWNVLAPDLPGHGRSGHRPAGRDGRADEGDGLENRCGRKVTGGSNPSSSATIQNPRSKLRGFFSIHQPPIYTSRSFC